MNFTSEVHQFQPYVPENPIDAMALVGSGKQQELQQGIQKVQGYVDYLHGFDLAKGATREYVQGKINDLKESVGNIAGNFSESRLTNQIGGLAGKIAGDPVVQNGIMSTAAYRKGVQDIEDSKKTGKDGKGGNYAVQNEWDFMTKAFDWLNDGDYTSSFSDSYTPHTDYRQMFTDAYKEIHPSSSLTQDQVRVNDVTGQIEVLNEKTSEGIDANEVSKLWNTVSSDPNVQRQIGIDARYNYKDYGPQDLYQHLSDDYSRNIDGINGKIKEIQERMTVDKTVSPVAAAQAIQALKDQGSQYAEQFKGIASMIPGVEGGDRKDLDAAKTAIFSTNLASSLASTYAWSKNTDKIIDSPLFKAHMDQIKYELNMAEFGETMRHNKATEQISLLNALKPKGSTKSTGEGETADGTPTITREDQVSSTAGEKGSATYYQTTRDKEVQLGQSMFEALFNMANSSGVDNPIAKTPNGFGYNTKYPGGVQEAINAGRRLWTAARQSQIEGTGKPSVINELENVDPLIREVNSRREVAKRTETGYEPALQQIATQYGKPIDRKMLDYWIVENNAPGKEQAQQRIDSLPNKEKDELYDATHSFTTTPYGKVPYSSTEYKDLDKFLKKNQSLLPTLQKREEDFKKAQTAFNPTVTEITTSKNENKETFRQHFAAIAQNYNLNGNADDFLGSLGAGKSKDKIDTESNIYKVIFDKNDNKWYLRISKAGKDDKDLEVQESDVSSLGLQTKDAFWDKFGADLQLTQNTSTQTRKASPDDDGNATAYQLQQPSGSKYQVRYHLYGSGNGQYGMRMFITDQKGTRLGTNVNLGNMLEKEKIMQILQTGLKDEEVEGLLFKNR